MRCNHIIAAGFPLLANGSGGTFVCVIENRPVPAFLVLAYVIKRVALWWLILKQDENRIWDEK